MSKLLRFRPLVVNPELAATLGLNEAIMLQQINYWIAETDSGLQKDGRKWIYNTYEQWQKQFPFWSADTIKRTLKSLKERGVLIIEQLNKSAHDRTNFYTIRYEHPALVEQGKMPSSIRAESSDLTYTTTKTTTEITTYTDAQSALTVIEQPKHAKPKKQKLTADDLFNEFKNHWPLIAQCDDEILRAWCHVRIEKKAAHTQIAHEAIEKELEILIHHGLTVTQAIREAAANGWKGLKSSWYDVVKYAGNAKPVDNYRTAAGAIERLNDTSWAE